MTEGKAARLAARRFATAALLVAALIALVPLYDCALSASGVQAEAAAAGLDAAPLLRASGAEDALAQLEEMADVGLAGTDVLPDAVARELGLPEGARDIRVSENGQVLGYMIDAVPAQALAQLEAHLASRGWEAVPLGDLDGATFVKDGGACTWALATCTQVGDATSVVVRCMLS